MTRYRRAGAEAGSATVWVLACVLVLLSVGTAVWVRAGAVLARHRVESAADLAALAAAIRIGTGAAPCDAAREIAGHNGARVVGCAPVVDAAGRSGTVRVEVAATVDLPLVGARTITASARAGRLPASTARERLRCPTGASAACGMISQARTGSGTTAPGEAKVVAAWSFP